MIALPFAARWLVPGLTLCLLAGASPGVSAREAPAPAAAGPAAMTVEQLAEFARKSVVVITVTGRDGKQQGLGTGFVIDADGLIATNHHVIGEARPISVQTPDGKTHPVVAVHASQRNLDLAIVKIDVKDLVPLQLGDSDALKQGQPVTALGNPHGLKYSVVSGVVSGTREIEGRQMLQLAIPIEPGNSGGPVVDPQGRVVGIVTMKSLVTPNLGFAMGVNALKPLLDKPNSVPMERWLTIGALDPKEWTQLFGARWRQRSGRILVDGLGAGFGGRSLCLAEAKVPEGAYEIGVAVKMESESGAAGIVFGSDGADRHYGFYPSNGRMRLSRFDGPDVFAWQVLVEKPSPRYRPGDWNELKVRVEKDKVLCYVNDQLVIERDGTVFNGFRVGLGKFRDTQAEFKGFQLGEKLSARRPSTESINRINDLVTDIAPSGPLSAELVGKLAPESGSDSLTVLRERAQKLEQQASQLRRLARAVHQQRVRQELTKAVAGKEDEIDLGRGALLIAWLDNDELDLEAYVQDLARMGREVTAVLPEKATDADKIKALNKYLFEDLGFHGSRGDYYNKANSYLNEVLDDREGLPITLAIVYMDLGQRLGLKFQGIGLPGHFVVEHVPAEGEKQLIDVYEGGVPLTRQAAAEKVLSLSGRPLQDADLAPFTKPAILVRVLRNLMGLAQDAQDIEAMLRYVEAILALTPDAAQERWFRAVLRYQLEDRTGAAEDVEWLLDHTPEGIDLDRVRELQRVLERAEVGNRE